jgi:hypothetical protein
LSVGGSKQRELPGVPTRVKNRWLPGTDTKRENSSGFIGQEQIRKKVPPKLPPTVGGLLVV